MGSCGETSGARRALEFVFWVAEATGGVLRQAQKKEEEEEESRNAPSTRGLEVPWAVRTSVDT